MKRLIYTSICSMALLAGGIFTATPAWAQPQRVSGMRGQERRESVADARNMPRPAASNNAGRRPSITTGGEGRQQRPMVSNSNARVAVDRTREAHTGIDHGVNYDNRNGGVMRSGNPGSSRGNNRPGGYYNGDNNRRPGGYTSMDDRNRQAHNGTDRSVNAGNRNGGDMRSRYPDFSDRSGDNYGDRNRPGNRPGGNYGDRNRPGKYDHGRDHYDHHRDYDYDRGPGHYDRYRYHDGYRPRDGRRDRMFVRYSQGWVRPWRPAPRPWHHTMWWYRRPAIPVGFAPLSGCPVIDGIIGLYFGTAYDASLNFLYCNGYNIDGYYNNVIYLNDVDLYGYSWPGVMLNYDPVTGLNYAQFSYYTSYSDSYRYNRLYRSLCDAYGRPVQVVSGRYPQVTWLGGDGRGYVTLSQNFTNGRFFTAITFGY